MQNVKYVKNERNANGITYSFKIYGKIADYVRETIKYGSAGLLGRLSDDDLFSYTIAPSDDFSNLHDIFVKTVEEISNAGDDAYFVNHLITNNGRHRTPSDIHYLMRTEFGLADINDTDTFDEADKDLEWWVAHFFIAFGRMLFDEPLENFDMALTEDAGSISNILGMLKNIDSIVVVDDVRKLSPEDMKKIHEDVRKG